MPKFQLPADLSYNRGQVQDPSAYAKERGVASWLFLIGEEFASMPGGISYAQVQQAVPHSAHVISDPPRALDLQLAREQMAALEALPRPTLVTCRTGPRASAAAYLYAALKRRASYEEVLAAAEQDNAPFCASAEIKEWLRSSLEALKRDGNAG